MALALCMAGAVAEGQMTQLPLAEGCDNIFALSLDDLLSIEVVSDTRRAGTYFDSAAATYVLTGEDIRRSGATSVPDALRMVPGLNVARVNSHKWAISARGFQSYIAKQLLVMIDGRTVYSPHASVVHWSLQDMVLADIERIEVIRGPGASQWGANAVNGIINIITKTARDTQGGYISTLAGDEDQLIAEGRYGGRMGAQTDYRLYAKYTRRDSTINPRFSFGSPLGLDDGEDAWESMRVGGRLDTVPAEGQTLTLIGEFYGMLSSELSGAPLVDSTPSYPAVPNDFDSSGAFLHGIWKQDLAEYGSLTVQSYLDHVTHEQVTERSRIDTFDLDIQHDIPLGSINQLAYGGGLRLVDDTLTPNTVAYTPSSTPWKKINIFAQDELTLADGRIALLFGSKLEWGDASDFEFQPTVRGIWKPTTHQRFWAAVSRAARTPNRVDQNVRVNAAPLDSDTLYPGQPGGYVQLQGSELVDSEEVLSYEAGYRVQPRPSFVLDLALFYNDYRDLVSWTSESSTGTPFINVAGETIVPVVYANDFEASTYGGELAAEWRILRYWRLSGSVTMLKMDIEGPEDWVTSTAGASPELSAHLRSFFNLPHDLEFDVMLYYVDELADINVEDYLRSDIRLGWVPTDHLELSLTFQNLFEASHWEHYEPALGTSAEIERSFYGKVTLRF